MKTKQSLIKSQVFSSIEKNLPRTGSKDVLQSGSHVRGDAMRGHEFSMPGAVKTPRPVTQLLLTVLRRAISMDVDILVRTLHSFLVWKSFLLLPSIHIEKDTRFFVGTYRRIAPTPSHGVTAAPRPPPRQRNGKLSCRRRCASAAAREAACAASVERGAPRPTPSPFALAPGSGQRRRRRIAIQRFRAFYFIRPIRSGAMHFACLTRTSLTLHGPR